LIAKLLPRIARDLLLIPLAAFLVFHAVALLPLASDDDRKADYLRGPSADVVELQREMGDGEGALRFTAPWRHLFRGDRLGSGSRKYTLADIAGALAGSLRIGGLAFVLALVLALGYAAARALRPPAVLDQILELAPTWVYGTPSFILALLVASFTGIATEDDRSAFEPVAALTVAIGPGIFLGVLLADALRTECDKPYYLAALARGRSRLSALLVHALPNAVPALLDALPPVATALLAGSFVIEKLFNLTYFGFIYVQWALERQLALVVIATTIFASLLILVALATDVLRAVIDPRERGRA
jgi:oligopeptide transport system permease protein